MKEVYANARSKMQKAIESLEANLAVLRTGRANPSLLNKIVVDYYGTTQNLNSLASITVTDARTLVVTPYDRSSINSIEKSIRDSDLGLNPSNKGDAIFLSIPALTEERRKELIKTAKHYGEEARVAVRNIRREAMDTVKKAEKDKLMGSDELKRAEAEIQKITDEFISKVDTTLETKETEILG